MQHIQWFPGHMTKSMRMIEDNIKLCDAVMYILDARCPLACINKSLIKLFLNRPILYVLNKSDLSLEIENRKWQKDFTTTGSHAICINGKDGKTAKILYDALKKMLAEKLHRDSEKGIFKPMRVMVAGIPNTGKSTIINNISGTKKAVTGDKAGVTRAKQWIKLYDIELLDTPGTMPPSFSNQTLAKHLAYIGSINDDILDFGSLVLELIGELKILSPDKLKERYGLEDLEKTNLEIYDDICRNRGYILKGGEIDYERGAGAIIDDFRKSKIGRITLERVGQSYVREEV